MRPLALTYYGYFGNVFSKHYSHFSNLLFHSQPIVVIFNQDNAIQLSGNSFGERFSWFPFTQNECEAKQFLLFSILVLLICPNDKHWVIRQSFEQNTYFV